MKPISYLVFMTLALVGCGRTTALNDQTDGSSELKGRRAAALKKFDKDGDGKLNEAEREVMRKERFAERLREARAGRGGFRFPIPPELVKKYDKDGDGRLNEQEEQAAREGMRRQW